jgi:Leucine-rich repeat (LRR) protein
MSAQGEEDLQLLNYEHNHISRISNLHNLGDLMLLDMFSNCIERISGLDSLSSLKHLLLGRNYIRSRPGGET